MADGTIEIVQNERNTGFSRQMLLFASVTALVLAFLPDPYGTILLYPIRLFVTFVHESGHAIAATLCGGDVRYLKVFANGEGVTYGATPAWAQWVFISGGYLGATLFGAILLQTVRKTGWNLTLYFLGGYIAAVTLLWAHNPVDNLFTLIAGGLLAAALIAAGKVLKPASASFLVAFLAVQCGCNAIGDLRILIYLTTHGAGENDAVFMSRAYFLPPTFWAVTWAMASFAVLLLSVWLFLGGKGVRRR